MLHGFRKRSGVVLAFIMVLLFFYAVPEKTLAFDIGLIDPGSLNQALSSWTVLDARPKKEWQSGRIPDAGSFCWEDYTRTDKKGIPYRILPPQELADVLGRMGIDENTPVVIYGDADTSWGGEGWSCWALAWLGHKGPVRLLDGGIHSWTELKLPVKTGNEPIKKEARPYHYQLQPSLDISADDIRANASMFQLVDTRSTLEWIRGHIPGAIHISWEKFFERNTRRPLSPVRTADLLNKNGVNPDKTVVYYCTGGVRSGYAWLVHTLAGFPPPLNFEGGMEEWNNSLRTE